MIKYILPLLFLITLTKNVYSDQVLDCVKYSKLSKKYYTCKTKQLKNKSNEFTVKPDLSNIMKKKTLADIFKKKEK